MNRKNVAIFGASSHVAKSLIYYLIQCEDERFSLDLYTRSPNKLKDFLGGLGESAQGLYAIHDGYAEVMNSRHDVLVNCVGVGTVNKMQGDYSCWFTVTEQYDNLAIEYLRRKSPNSLYVSISSGAVYGRDFPEPVHEDSLNAISVNHVASEDYYAIARLNAEAKHRSFVDLNIVDLRLFSYFSRFIDMTDSYFMTDLINAVHGNRVFTTNSENMVRDYVHPKDLFVLLR